MDDDLELFTRWQAGDATAGNDLVARHFTSIYRFFEYKVRDRADDLAQRTFLQCIQARDTFRRRSSFRTYLFAIARNELYQHLRREANREYIDFEELSIEALTTPPGGKLDREHEKARLMAALRSLPVQQQELLELHYWEGLDAAQLADVFELEPGAIRVRLSRAREALRKRLEPEVVLQLASDRLVSSLGEPDEA